MSRRSAMEILFAGLGVVALSGLVVFAVHQRDQFAALRAENQGLQASAKELERLRAENQEAQRLRNQETEIQQLREDNRELLRLRNEVRQLREQQQELETLRAANAQLLQAVQSSGSLPPDRMALLSAARRKGSILGVNVGAVNDPRPGGRPGVTVTGLMAGVSATDLDLKIGDVIRAVNGRAIETVAQLQAEMLTHKPDETLLVDVLRGGEAMRLQVKTRAWPASP